MTAACWIFPCDKIIETADQHRPATAIWDESPLPNQAQRFKLRGCGLPQRGQGFPVSTSDAAPRRIIDIYNPTAKRPLTL